MNDTINTDINESDINESDKRCQINILARTIYGEARGESVRGKEAVASVIINRVNYGKMRGGYWWGDDVVGVCKKPYQFSCWNENDPNFKKITDVMPGHKVFDTCLRIAKRALAGTLIDPTNGATHYHHENINPPWARAKAPDAHIGKHLFYSNIE